MAASFCFSVAGLAALLLSGTRPEVQQQQQSPTVVASFGFPPLVVLNDEDGYQLPRLELHALAKTGWFKCLTRSNLVLVQSDVVVSCSDALIGRLAATVKGSPSLIEDYGQFQRAMVISQRKRSVNLLSGARKASIDSTAAATAGAGLYQQWWLGGDVSGLVLCDSSPAAADTGAAPAAEAVVTLPLGVALNIDLHLFLPATVHEDVALLHSQNFGSAICSSLATAFQRRDSSLPFTISSSAQKGKLLGFWLDYCSLGDSTPVVHLWPFTQMSIRARRFVVKTIPIAKKAENGLLVGSPCDVKSVSGLSSSFTANSTLALDCVEDVFRLLLDSSLRNAAESNHSFVYASSLWLGSVTTHASTSWEVEFAELARAVRAFLNHHMVENRVVFPHFPSSFASSALEIRSLWRGLLSEGGTANLASKCARLSRRTVDSFGTSLRLNLLDIIYHDSSSGGVGGGDNQDHQQVWASLLSQLEDSLASLPGARLCIDSISILQILRIVVRSVREYVLDDSLQLVCDPLPPSTYLCSHDSARAEFAAALDGMTKVLEDWSNPQERSNSGLLASVQQLAQKIRSSTSVTSSQQHQQQQHHCYDGNPASGFLQPQVTVTSSFVHILIFVLQEHFQLAQEAANEMKHQCTTRICHLYTTYSVFSVPSEGDIHRTASSGIPSTRLAFLLAREYFATHLRTADVVAVLLGLDALFAFFPASANGKGFIPSPAYGSNAYYPLPSSIIVAASASSAFSNIADQTCIPFACSGGEAVDLVWEPRALAGVAWAVDRLMESLAENKAAYAEASDRSLHCSVVHFASLYPRDVFLDLGRSYFDFSIGQAASESILRAKRDGAIDPEFDSLSLRFPNFFNSASEAKSPGALLIEQSYVRLQKLAPTACIMRSTTESMVVQTMDGLRNANALFGYTLAATELMSNCFSCCCLVQAQPLLALYPTRDLLELGKFAPHLVGDAPLAEFFGAQRVLEDHLGRQADESAYANDCVVTIATKNLFDNAVLGNLFEAAVYGSLAGILVATGDIYGMVTAYSNSLRAVEFKEAFTQRGLWADVYRPAIISVAGNKTHFLTMASNMTENLALLQYSAAVSGVELITLGVGKPWHGNRDKVLHYLAYLEQQESVRDDDVVVLIDAYDVLLFPAALHIGAVFAAEAPTSVMFCAESGVYPEAGSAYIYRRGLDGDVLWKSHDHGQQRFFNTGCIVGRAAQVREMMKYAHALSDAFEDDQHLLIRYALAHPEVVSLDQKHQFFLTTHKFVSVLNLDLDFALLQDGGASGDVSLSVAAVHCNNIGSNYNLHYGRLAAQMRKIRELFYQGDAGDGPELLQVVGALAVGDFATARKMLLRQQEEVSSALQSNMMSGGGQSCVGDYLIVKHSRQLGLNKLETKQFAPGAAACTELAKSLREP